jgi:hypothetical protein
MSAPGIARFVRQRPFSLAAGLVLVACASAHEEPPAPPAPPVDPAAFSGPARPPAPAVDIRADLDAGDILEASTVPPGPASPTSADSATGGPGTDAATDAGARKRKH